MAEDERGLATSFTGKVIDVGSDEPFESVNGLGGTLAGVAHMSKSLTKV